jgi:hypothetical protein
MPQGGSDASSRWVTRLADVGVDQPLDEQLFRFTPAPDMRVRDLLAGRGRRSPMIGQLRRGPRVRRRSLGRHIHRG